LNEEEAAKFILQILEGVRHMHEKNVVHLDLKVCLLIREDRMKMLNIWILAGKCDVIGEE